MMNTVPNAAQVLHTLSTHREKLRQLGVKRLSLFGSSVRNDATSTSDLDFLLELHHETFDAYMQVKFFLEELFGVKVDLGFPDTLKPRLRSRILSEAVDVPGL